MYSSSIFAIGSMLGWWFVVVLQWPLWATLLGTIAITALLGVLIEYFCVRPFGKAPPIAMLLSTLAVSFVLDYSSQLIFSPETRRFPSLLPTDNLQLGGLRIGTLDVTILGVSLVSVVALWSFLKYTRTGRAIRATLQDREAALQMGIAVGRMQGLSFAIASAFGGIAGVLVGMYLQQRLANERVGCDAFGLCRRDVGWAGQSAWSRAGWPVAGRR